MASKACQDSQYFSFRITDSSIQSRPQEFKENSNSSASIRQRQNGKVGCNVQHTQSYRLVHYLPFGLAVDPSEHQRSEKIQLM